MFLHTPTPKGTVIMGIVNKLSKLIELWNPLHSSWICLLIWSSLISVLVLSLFSLRRRGVMGVGAGGRWMVRTRWCQRSTCSSWRLHWQPSGGHWGWRFSHLSRIIRMLESSGRKKAECQCFLWQTWWRPKSTNIRLGCSCKTFSSGSTFIVLRLIFF